ncbi:E3 ISG15--protein ligase Herc6-like, partial [Oppia nitens]|uniref:E3 ISG15--protein ligase Herc6-like n=1 Tax=Oppia nitens TaxID=1686743 RepID=UPI0023DBDC67
MQPVYNDRPTCAQIIEQYNDWAIDSTVVTTDVKFEEKLKKIKHKEWELHMETKTLTPNDWIKSMERFYVFDDELGVNVLFVTTDDRVYGLGANYYGSLGLGHNQWVSEPQEIRELRHKKCLNFINGRHFMTFLSNDNCLYSCGLNVWGELGNGCRDFETNKPMIVEINAKNDLILDVSCGSYHTLIVTQNNYNNNNEVYGWGKNKFGQIGSRDTTCDAINTPEKIEFNGNYCIKCVHCFEQSSFALTMDGQVFSWGQNRSQQLGLNSSNDFIVKPQLICNLSGITSIQSGSLNTYFSSHYNNEVYFCGQYYTNNNISD